MVSSQVTPSPSSSSSSSLRSSGKKPLPLKQRTSSVDTRHDFSSHTWTSLLNIVKPREYIVTVNNFSIWRRHLSWAMENGGDLRNHMTQRYSSNMVFMSLLLGTELSVLLNPDPVTSSIRKALLEESFSEIEYWIGFVILISIVLTLLSLVSTFTAWGMVSSISDCNAHCILRSSIGQYVAELPGRLIVLSIYSFLVWVILSIFLLLPMGVTSIFLVTATVVLFFHVVVVFSAFGRIIMHTGAMAPRRIFDEKFEKSLLPRTLHANLLKKAQAELANNTSITRQYRRRAKPIYREFDSHEDLSNHLRSDSEVFNEDKPRGRADSTVRFADQLWSVVPTTRTDTNLRSSSMETSNEKEDDEASPPLTKLSVEVSGSSGAHLELPDQTEFGVQPPSIRSVEDWLQAGSSSITPDTQTNTPLSPPLQTPPLRRSPPPVETISTVRQLSVTSTLQPSTFEEKLSEEERFDLEYGDLFDPETGDRNLADDENSRLLSAYGDNSQYYSSMTVESDSSNVSLAPPNKPSTPRAPKKQLQSGD